MSYVTFTINAIKKSSRLVLATALLLSTTLICPLATAYPKQSYEFAPKDTSIYLEINHLGSWLGKHAHNPLINYLRAEVNILHAPDAWRHIHNKLELTSDEMVKQYLGTQTGVVIGQPIDGVSQSFITMKSDKEHQQLIRQKLGLIAVRNVKIDGFNIFQTPFKDSYIAIGYNNPWIVVCHPASKDFMIKQLKASGSDQQLSSSVEFKKLVKLRKDTDQVVFFSQSVKEQKSISLIANQKPKSFTVEFNAKAPESFKAIYRNLSPLSAGTFCPLPKTATAVATVNSNSLFLPEDTAFLDRLLAPAKFEQIIGPHLKTPVVLFSDRNKDNQMSFGMAIKVNNKSTIKNLHRLLDRFALYMNQANADDSDDIAGITIERHQKLKFYTHPLSLPLTKMLGINARNFGKLTFGQIGEWFYVSTNQAMHKSCIDAFTSPKLALNQSIVSELAQFEKTKRNWISVYTRSSDFESMLGGLIQPSRVQGKNKTAKRKQSAIKNALRFFLPTTPESRLFLALKQLTDPRANNASITVQVDLPDETSLKGKLILQQR